MTMKYIVIAAFLISFVVVKCSDSTEQSSGMDSDVHAKDTSGLTTYINENDRIYCYSNDTITQEILIKEVDSGRIYFEYNVGNSNRVVRSMYWQSQLTRIPVPIQS
jgi:hypothetical protein